MASVPDPTLAKHPSKAFDDSAAAVLGVIDAAAENHSDDPQSHIQAPAVVAEDHPQPWLRKHLSNGYIEDIESSYHLGFYILDRQSGDKTFESMSIYVRLGMHFLYYGSYQATVLHFKRTEDLLKSSSVKLGKKYDSPESVAHIAPFITSFNLADSMSEMVESDPTKYKTFNDFFSREIREECRPIAEPDNDLVVSSPADCRCMAFQTIDMAERFWIKGFGFTIEKLLGNKEIASQFDGGSIIISRLAPQDYHRWHAPVSGTVSNVYDIPGTYYTVNPQAINQAGTLDVFCENRRSVMIVERKGTKAPVAVVAVGAMLVGSIKYLKHVADPGQEIRRGQCLGMFRYGGSTVITLVPKGELVVDADLAANATESVYETLVKVGWRIGVKQG